MDRARRTIIGTAGWALSAEAERFAEVGTVLERYAAVFDGVEVNSSFHRRHQPKTWARWAESTPDRFRFAVKLPKTITHQAKLVDTDGLVEAFLCEVAGLGGKLAVLLIQLPPSLAFDPDRIEPFLSHLAGKTSAQLACEPRHASWFDGVADVSLARLGIARVAADPALNDRAARPGGATSLAYWRLHGSPRMYRSEYGADRLSAYAAQIGFDAAVERWCMFDNTASSAAIRDALRLAEILA